ncbi:MAG: hypothetical protein C0402_13660 [Thermodesulfovibrio sp.]|nr:hypothetical protein [Thermodesulfovibrio sp.]
MFPIMKTKYKTIFLTALFIFNAPSNAHAHGEDILVAVGIQLLLSIGGLIYILFMKTAIYKKVIYSSLLIVSGIIAWLITADIPYNKNKALINAIFWGCPALSLGFILMANKFINKTKGKT